MPRSKAAKNESVTKLVDPSKKGVLQTGFIGGDPPEKPPLLEEELTPEQQIEKRVYQSVLKQLVPKFRTDKLEKQTLEKLKLYFDAVSPFLQDELFQRFKDFSP